MRVVRSIEQYIDHAFGLRHSDGQLAVDAAREAVRRIANLQDVAPAAFDLRAKAALVLGNALRIVGNRRCAGRALRVGEAYRRQGTGRVDLRLLSLMFFGSLSLDMGRPREAEIYLRTAEHVAGAAGLDLVVARARLKLAAVAVDHGDHGRAVRIIEQVLQVGGLPRELRQVAHQVAIAALALDGRTVDAYTLWEMSRPLFEDAGELLKLKFRWAGGLVLAQVGRPEFLAEVRAEYLRLEMGFEAALVTLDMAECATRRGDMGSARDCLRDAEPVLSACGLAAATAFSVSAAAIRSLRIGLATQPAGAVGSQARRG